MKLLTICIPTYKRPATLRRCIQAAVEQVQHSGLADKVTVYVTNDASPDNTAQVIGEFADIDCFRYANREKNLGMSANIKCMLEEALQESVFQLIITDDDYLQPGMLETLVTFLESTAVHPDIPLIWTPRYSYLEDDSLHCIVCNPFQGNATIPPSIRNAGRYMFNGFVLSGLIVKAREIDFSLWDAHIENAYFPVIVSGDLLLRKSALYWDANLIHHTVMNACPWERWGQSDAEITLRLYTDFMNAFVVIGRKAKTASESLLFYSSAFPSMLEMTNSLLILSGGFSRLNDAESAALLNIDRVAFSRIETPARPIFFKVITRILARCWYQVAKSGLLSRIALRRTSREQHRQTFIRHRQQLANAAFVLRWARR